MGGEHFRKFDINQAAKKIQAVYRGFCVRKLFHLSFSRFQNICGEVEKSLLSLFPTSAYKFIYGTDYIESEGNFLPLFFIPPIEDEKTIHRTKASILKDLQKEEAWLQKALLDRILFLKNNKL